MNKNMKQAKEVVIYCDGFLKYKDLRDGCSIGIVQGKKTIVKRFEVRKDPQLKGMIEGFKRKNNKITTNDMEYFAMYRAIQAIRKIVAKKRIIYSDSMLVVNQVNGEWQISEDKPHLLAWRKRCRLILPKDVIILWIRRNANVKILNH